MSWLRALRFVALGLVLAYAFPAACGSGGVVGGKCRSGFSNCNGACVDLQVDVDNCGQCENVCLSDEGCGAGVCDPDVPRPQGGASSIGGASNGVSGEEQGGTAQLPDGGSASSGDGGADTEMPVDCLPPHNEPSHCGDCDTDCAGTTPLCAPDGNGSFECVPVCEPPLIRCRGRCVLTPDAYQSDPENCGRCNNSCPSDICKDGRCEGRRYGNIALLCMDLNSSMSDSGSTLILANAMLLPATEPVNVLAYTRGATPGAVTKVHRLASLVARARGRNIGISEAKTVAAVTDSLNVTDYQVLLVHDLDLAAAGEPASAATTWDSNGTISSFVAAGGVVIVLDGGDGRGEMHEFITAANLLNVTGQTEITGTDVFNNAPTDVLASALLTRFLGTSHTCTFQTSVVPDGRNVFVITNADGEPVVIHRVVTP